MTTTTTMTMMLTMTTTTKVTDDDEHAGDLQSKRPHRGEGHIVVRQRHRVPIDAVVLAITPPAVQEEQSRQRDGTTEV